MQYLQDFDKRCAAIRNRLHYVLTCPDVFGFYVWGPHGSGKTVGIERALDEMQITPIKVTGSITGPALFELARNHRDGLIWINDGHKIFSDNLAPEYLLHMLNPSYNAKTQGSARVVTQLRVHGVSDSFTFKGKLCFDANAPVSSSSSLKRLQAVEDRMEIVRFNPGDQEIAAVMRYLAELTPESNSEYQYIQLHPDDRKYWKVTTVEQRKEIAEHVIQSHANKSGALSLRAFIKKVKYFRYEQKYGYSTSWRDDDDAVDFSSSPRESRLQKEREVLMEVLEDIEDLGTAGFDKAHVVRAWTSMTHQSEKQIYRRLKEIPEALHAVWRSLADGRTR